MNAVLRSVALLGVGHLAVAWNEAMVFRDYRFETVRGTRAGQSHGAAHPRLCALSRPGSAAAVGHAGGWSNADAAAAPHRCALAAGRLSLGLECAANHGL